MNTSKKSIKQIALGLMAIGLAIGTSAYTEYKSSSSALAGETYVNLSLSPDQYSILSTPYDDKNCQNSSEMICSYIRTDFEPSHQLPNSFTNADALNFVAAGWLEPNSNKEGIYTP